MSQVPSLCFDKRDKKAVEQLLGDPPGGGDAWEYACQRARTIFARLLEKHQSMTDYLGGRPMDTDISSGELHAAFRGLGVVFELNGPSSVPGTIGVVGAHGVALPKNVDVLVRFWCIASAI